MAQNISPSLDEVQRRWIEKRPEQTVLLVGPDAEARALWAEALGKSLVCESPLGPGTACGKCGPCVRFAHRQSEALLWISLEKNQITMEQAHQVLEFLRWSSISKHRVVVIPEAQHLNGSAANSLLKILEEPPPQTCILLGAPSAKQVLPTVRSRSLLLKVPELHRGLEHLDQELRERVKEVIDWWCADPLSYLRPAFRERVKEKEFSAALAMGFQDFFRRQALDSLEDQRVYLLQLFDLALSTEIEVGLGSRDLLLVWEEFWIRTRGEEDP